MATFCTACGILSLIVVILAILLQLYATHYMWPDPYAHLQFNRRSTADEAASDIDLSNKTIIVTGASSGIGIVTARVLLSHGATVIMACRNVTKAQHVKDQIIHDLVHHKHINFLDQSETDLHHHLDIIEINLASLKSIESFAQQFTAKYNNLHYLILNAGVAAIPQWTPTVDGIEQQFGVNHLGHFYLTRLLEGVLIQTAKESDSISRVIVVASRGHKLAPQPLEWWLIKEHRVQNASQYAPMRNYGFSKACNILFAKGFNRRYGQFYNVHALALHPGEIWTEITRNARIVNSALITNVLKGVVKYALGNTLQTVEQGAATTLRVVALSDEEFVKYGGSYWRYCNVADDDLRRDMKDETHSRLIWDLSIKMINKRKGKPKKKRKK